jgi:hypothetical protein
MLIGIPLAFNFTPLSNFSLSLFQVEVLHRRITNETNDNELNEQQRNSLDSLSFGLFAEEILVESIIKNVETLC